MTLQARAPGKLYIAGEYAVVEPGQPAVLVAVDRHITVQLAPATVAGHIRSDQYKHLPLTWHRRDNDLVIDPDESPYDFVLAAIRVVEEAVADRGAPLHLFDLDIASELDDASGRKFGLGSSAAVTVATVTVVAAFYGLDLTDLERLKLALLATIQVQRSGSGGDVAASVFGGWIAYTAFDRAWVREQRPVRAIWDLLDADWPGLSVRRLTPPPSLRLIVGWTGTPASTARLVSGIQSRKDRRSVHYSAFLHESRACVEQMVAAFDTGDAAGIQREITHDRTLLRELSAHTGVSIETDLLRTLADTAEAVGAAAKSSGAGGGDCGIVLATGDCDIDGLLEQWERAGIQQLPLAVTAPQGVIA